MGRQKNLARLAVCIFGLGAGALACQGQGDTNPACRITLALQTDLAEVENLAATQWHVDNLCLAQSVVSEDCPSAVSTPPYTQVGLARQEAELIVTSYKKYPYPGAPLTLQPGAAADIANLRAIARALAACWLDNQDRPCDRLCQTLRVNDSETSGINLVRLYEWFCEQGVTADDFSTQPTDPSDLQRAEQLFRAAQTLLPCSDAEASPSPLDFQVTVEFENEYCIGRHTEQQSQPILYLEKCSLPSQSEVEEPIYVQRLRIDGGQLTSEDWFAYWSDRSTDCGNALASATGTLDVAQKQLQLTVETAHPSVGGCF